jgi:uncharacterized protein
MNMKNIQLLILALILALSACRNKDDKKDEGPDFDRQGMLTNIGENIILPNYASLKTDVEGMDASIQAFTDNPNISTLEEVQAKFKSAYLAWQSCSLFELGPAEEELLRANLNTFPTNRVNINNNIASGSYNLGSASNLSAKGFPAIDYLLYGFQNTKQEIVDQYTVDANALNRKNYLKAISAEIKLKTSNVYNAWSPSGGNYLNTFKNNSGTDVGSSLGMLVNQLNYDLEFIKNPKIGTPLGKQSLGQAIPANTEAYYGGFSMELANKNILNIENVYLGRSAAGIDGVGLDDYVLFLKKNSELSNTIKGQFSLIISKMSLVGDPLSEKIISAPTLVDDAYKAIQMTVVYTKTDMTSAMGILITYQDNDGD